MLIPKSNGSACLHSDTARLNEVLIRLVYRGPIVNDIFQKLTNVHYITLSDANLGYHNLKLDKNHCTSQLLYANLAGTGMQDYH